MICFYLVNTTNCVSIKALLILNESIHDNTYKLKPVNLNNELKPNRQQKTR